MPCFLISKSMARATMSRGRELGAFVVARHEALAVGKLQQPAFAAHRLGNQERLRVGMEEARGMELDEFHVRDRSACAPPHGDAVPGGGVGVGGVEVDLARAAGTEQRVARAHGLHAAALMSSTYAPQTRFAPAVSPRCFLAVMRVDADVPIEHVDIRMALHLLHQGFLDRAPGGVGRMDDAPVAMAAFAREVKLVLVVVVPCEWHSLCHEPFHRAPAPLDHEAHRLGVAEPGPGNQGVADVVFHRVGAVEDGGRSRPGPSSRPRRGARAS